MSYYFSTTENANNYNYLIKLIIVGDSSVGKSTFLYRMSDNLFISDNEPTIGVEFRSLITSSQPPYGMTFKVQLWDTSGQDRFRSIVRSYYRYAQGCFLVFDIHNRISFDNLKIWLEDIKKNVTIMDKQIILIGTKIDIPDRNVSTTEAQTFAIENNLAGYVEISSKTGIGIDTALNTMVQSIAELICCGKLDKILESQLGLGYVNLNVEPTPSRCCSYI
jgi:small GTP-binding protein